MIRCGERGRRRVQDKTYVFALSNRMLVEQFAKMGRLRENSLRLGMVVMVRDPFWT